MNGHHFDSTAKGGLYHGDRELAVYIISLPLEKFMLFHMKNHVEIACGSTSSAALTLITQSHLRTRIHTGWDFERHRFGLFDKALPIAVIARIFDNLSF